MTDWAGNLDHLKGTTATEAFDAVARLEARVAELEAALLAAVEVLRTYDLTATADRCERVLKGKSLD